MIAFTYNDSSNRECSGEICILTDYDPIEMDIEANGWTFHTIVGEHRDGNYICIPNWNIGSELAGLRDVFWNEERLKKYTNLNQVNAMMPHKPLQTYDRKMKRFVTASESKAVTAEGISNNIVEGN